MTFTRKLWLAESPIHFALVRRPMTRLSSPYSCWHRAMAVSKADVFAFRRLQVKLLAALLHRAKRESRATAARSSRGGGASRWGSYHCQVTLLRSGGCVFERGENVLAFQVGVVGKQLVDAGTTGKLTEHCAHRHAGVADAGQAAHTVWIDGDSLLGHRATVPRRPPATSPAGPTYAESTEIVANPCASAPVRALVVLPTDVVNAADRRPVSQ